MLFSAVDLVPKENAEKWIECLQREFPVVAFKASTQMRDKTVVRRDFQYLKKHFILFSNICLIFATSQIEFNILQSKM